jgi:hypothetical protein
MKTTQEQEKATGPTIAEDPARAAVRTNLADRIELRRFVGRELLLWLWLESELFEATLSTAEHGSFGLWLEGRLVLDQGAESTIIKGSAPGLHRDAKEALLRGKMPERAGLRLSFGDHDCALTLRGESLAFAGLVPPRKEREAPPAEQVLAGPPRRPGKKKNTAGGDLPGELEHEGFYDRMRFAAAVEELVTALYREFLAIRLSPVWDADVVPALERWAAGEPVNVGAYQAARARALGGRKKKPPAASRSV